MTPLVEDPLMKQKAKANLVLHCGAREVSRQELVQYHAPAPEGRWHPIAHARVVDVVERSLVEGGYTITRAQYGVTPDGHRLFGVMELDSLLTHGVTLAVGVRNSTNRTFPLGFVAGNRVFTCDNLAFRSELLVRRKHTINGEKNFTSDISNAVAQLAAFKEQEAFRIQVMQETPLADDLADALILRAFERGIIGPRELPRVIEQWREPSFEEFRGHTLWGLFNAVTTVLGEKATSQPSKHAMLTMRLNMFLMPPTALEHAQAG